MYEMTLNERSKEILSNIHPKLAEVIYEARELSEVEFEVVLGQMSGHSAETMFEKGAWLNPTSLHSYGVAVSLLVSVQGIPCTNSRAYEELASSIKYAAENVGVGILWGAARNIPNLCEWEGEMDEAVTHFAAETINKNGVLLDLAPGYFELVLD